jgi:sulfoxide reductase heme-binding subunit YedZ
MGGHRWQALHRLIYLAAPLGVVHFLWGQKKDIRLPLVYAAVLALIFAARLLAARPARASRVAEAPTGR